MDAQTRYSSGSIVPSTSLSDAVATFESHWIAEFWPPHAVQADPAFHRQTFLHYLSLYDIRFRPVPPHRHSKNVLESKHRILRDIFLRLKSASPDEDRRLLIAKMFRISNDLYGNTTASAHELAQGYTRPITHDPLRLLPLEIVKAHEELIAKRKLNLILSPKSITEPVIDVGDIIQVYTRLQNQKRGKWSDPQPVLQFEPDSKTIKVAGPYGRRRRAAIEDVRIAITEQPLAIEIQSALDELTAELEELITDDTQVVTSVAVENDGDMHDQDDVAMENVAESSSKQDIVLGDTPLDTEHPQDDHDDNTDLPVDNEDETNLEALTYVPAAPSTYDPDNDQAAHIVDHINQQQQTGIAPVSIKKWKQPPAPSTHAMKTRSSEHISSDHKDASGLRGNAIELLPGTELSSQEQKALKQYYSRFSSKEFLLHQTQGLPTYVTDNAYNVEENSFVSTCERIHRSEVPPEANIIGSHVLYKIKTRDDGSLTCKARIVPHGNEDRDRNILKTDSASCPPLGVRVLFSLSVVMQWYLTKIDVKSAFWQSGSASRDVYVVPPRESADQDFCWLLTVATYGLVNDNATWQLHSDTTFIEFRLSTVAYIPQLFFLRIDGALVLLAVKIVDDIFIGGKEEIKKRFISKLPKIYKLGTITHLPGSCLFFGLKVTQDDDFHIIVHADQKLNGINAHQLSRYRRKQPNTPLNKLELFHFNSVNGSLGFIGVQASPFAAFTSSYLQQRRNCATVHDMIIQHTMIKKLKRLGSTTTYLNLKQTGEIRLSVLMFSDATRPSGHGQLGFIGGLLFGDICEGCAFHVLSWSSYLSKRPTKSIGSEEILAAGSAINEGMLVSSALSVILNTEVRLVVAEDSKNLFDSFTSCHVLEDKSIRSDVQLIRYNFETKKIHKIIWIAGSNNLADPLTKKDSRLTDTLQLMLFEGVLPLSFPGLNVRCSSQNLG